jgi:predicted negative regulator of RcsB-dependent stress response
MSEAATQTQTLEQTLNKTDLGHLIYENKNLFFGLLIAVLLGSTGFAFWKQSQKSAALEISVKVFEFQSGIWTEVKNNKKDISELMKAFEALDEKARTAPIMVPVALEISKFLMEKGNYPEADTILSKVGSKSTHPVSAFFLSMQRAVVLEKLGKIDDAISQLESLSRGEDALLPAKTSLELGRLYLLKGEKGKAQTQFDFIISNYPNDEQAKIVKLYLQELK